ncbi:rab11 family-interacting protein 1 [Rhinophrynus dorsalis]
MSLALQSQTWFPTHVQVTVLQAKALRSKGKAGTNDAYAIIQLSKEKYSTTVAEKSVAPVWKEEATFEVPLLHIDNQERCTVRIIVMHRALVGMDKFLGQLDLNLWELHQSRNRRKVQWYPLKSKPGKKEKERGQIEVEVQFMRNNMTASMFDLSMKEKSRSPFGKLKDKIKGKRQDGFPDTASAIVPSMNQYPDDSDEEMPEAEKKKSKLKTLFSKPGLKKNSISQSMSVLPTFPPSSSPRTMLKPGDFSSDFNQASGSPVSERRFHHLPVIMTHKRTVSADTSGNKKEGLSLFSGMKSKNDPITRSNLCINGNHVYMEDSEPRSESPKDNSLTNSPQIIRRTPLYASAENLSSKPPKETENASPPPEKEQITSTSNDSEKSFTLSANQNSRAEEPRSRTPPLSLDMPKETKENKKQENKMSSLLSLVTGRKDSPKTAEVEKVSDVPMKVEEPKATNGGIVKVEQPTVAARKNNSLNPFEDDMEENKRPEHPPPPERAAKTTAVKPRLDVSSEAETNARLSSSSLSKTSSFLAASLSGGHDSPQATLHDLPTSSDISLSSPTHDNSPHSPSEIPTTPETESNSEGPIKQFSEYENPSVPFFWRSGVSSNKPSEPKEVQVVAPFSEKGKVRKTSVKSLLDHLKGKSTPTAEPDAVDVDLVRGVLPVHEDASPIFEDPGLFSEKKTDPALDGFEYKEDTLISKNVNEPPKPTPRIQSIPQKDDAVGEEKPVPPKPAPRKAAKLNKINTDIVIDSEIPSQPALLMDRSSSMSEPLPKPNTIEQASRVGSSMTDDKVQSEHTITNMKMASPVTEDLSYRLDELPVIPENPEGTSDDEQLEAKRSRFPAQTSSTSNRSFNVPVVSGQISNVHTNTGDETQKDEFDFALAMKDTATEVKVKSNSLDKAVHNIPDSHKEHKSLTTEPSENELKNNSHFTPQHTPENISAFNTLPSSSSLTPASLPTTTTNTSSAETPTNPTSTGSDKTESSGKKKLLRAWVSPSETHPIPTVQNGGTGSSRQRTNPVKPMNSTQTKTLPSFSQPIKTHSDVKKYDSSDPAAAYAQLTHDELIQLVLKQKDIISKKDIQVRELEDYIDNLLVRVMEETPNILRSITQASKKAGRL